ncbi:hypothetical protein PHMEG_00031575 [Phytophthora megakarya]|uniref:Uncharacterized protein n=1 Tax=Phytophthora megakarya TaxID=4795 RepID=A0A225UWF8_9STRA|nr:hypothetical protein PHMEG_00031575 [Phytophthora megakarya]
MDEAAVFGHLDVVKWFHASQGVVSTSHALIRPIISGNFDMVFFLHLHSIVRFMLPLNIDVQLPPEMQQWLLANYTNKVRDWEFKEDKIKLEALWNQPTPQRLYCLTDGSRRCATAPNTRYCLPEGVDDLPHVTLQNAEFLDTFSSTTIVRAYKRTGSLRCIQYVASHELPETQDPFYKRWLLNRTAELAASWGDLPTLQWLLEVYLPVEPMDNVVEVAATFGHLDMLQWLYRKAFTTVIFIEFTSEDLKCVEH